MTDFDLRSVDLFANLDDADLAAISASLTTHDLAEGSVLFREGDPGDVAYVVCGGEIEVIKESAGKDVRIAVVGAGGVIGEMALLASEPRSATCVALTNVTLISIPAETFNDVITQSPSAMRAMFDVFIARGREQEARLRQSERMAQLGVLTAGLAHEMNNPAAAVTRGAAQLADLVDAYGSARQHLDDDVGLPRPTGVAPRSTIERVDREAELESLLTDAGLATPWEAAPALAAAGFVPTDLTDLGDEPAVILEALRLDAEVAELVHQIQEGSSRLSDLVAALKSYSFLDQAPVQDVDVVKGIEDTLLILGSKTKDIDIERRYADDVPTITAYGSQLNQVWTNLIDNAVDAIHDGGVADGVIRIDVAASDEGGVIVVVANNGPRIPDEIQERIFEAFFTTKEPGKGTGLGLDTVYNIVVTQHRGQIDVASDDATTAFTVVLPPSP